jgi:hypothetical protein
MFAAGRLPFSLRRAAGQLLPHYLAASSLERGFLALETDAQKGPGDDVSKQRPEIGDHDAPEIAAKLPLYRQEAIYARVDVDLDWSLMAQWMSKVGFELQPLADYVLEKIQQGERIFADETTLPTLAPGSGKTQKAWLWAYARDDRPFGGIGPPLVAYRFEDSRGGECVERHLAGFTGILQVDGYAAYNRLARSAGANEGVTPAACFAHVRRRFYEVHVNESSRLATQTVTTMAGLWEIEADIRGQDPEMRVRALVTFTSFTILPASCKMQTLVSLTDTSSPAKCSMLRFSF